MNQDVHEGTSSMAGVAEAERRAQLGLRERTKQLAWLYGIIKVVVRPAASRDEILQSIQVALIIKPKETEGDRARLQQRLPHADRLATIGQLAAGVAHERNEPLANILGVAQLANQSAGLPAHMVVMREDEVLEVGDLPTHMHFSNERGRGGLRRTLAEVEVAHNRNVLASVDGNKTRAAEMRGIDRKTLRERQAEAAHAPMQQERRSDLI